jgi:hypothetical protein
MSHFLIHAARLQDAGISHLLLRLEVAEDGTRLMRVVPHMPYKIATDFPTRTFELCGTDRLLETLQDDMAYSVDGPTPEKLEAAIKAHPAAADDLRGWYADWLLSPPLTDEEIADLPEVADSKVDSTVRWVKGVMKGLDIARQREAMKTPAASADTGGVPVASEASDKPVTKE